MSDGETRFGDLTDAAAARWGDREALVFRDHRYSFRQIAGEVDRVARGLIHAGIAPGDMVALWLLNCPEWIFAMFALAKIGVVHVPINYLGMVRELAAREGAGGDRRVRSARPPDLRRVIAVGDRGHPGARTCR